MTREFHFGLDAVGTPAAGPVNFIRPVHDDASRLLSLALCTTNGIIETDDQILSHFDANESGVVIRAESLETWSTPAVWGRCLYVSVST
jgi:hypothetical protein